jgi:hypothetical protein
MVKVQEPPFTLDCHGAFRPNGVWRIEVSIRYRDGFPGEGSRLLGEGRIALVEDREGPGGPWGHPSVVLDEGGRVVTPDPNAWSHLKRPM